MSTAASSGAAKEPAQTSGVASAQRTNPFQASADRVRAAAKWLVAAFAAIATTFLAGTQFSSIGSLPVGPRLFVAIAAAAVVVGALAVMIWILLDVLLVSQVTLGDLADEDSQSDLIKLIKRNPAWLSGFESVRKLSSAYLKALRTERQKWTAYHDARTSGADSATLSAAKEDAEAANDWLVFVRKRVSFLVDVMAFQKLRERMAGWRRWALFVGAVLVALGLGVFAWAVNPANKTKASNASSKSSPAAIAIGLRPRRPCVVSVRVDGKRTRTVKPGKAVVTISDASRLCGVTVAGAGLVVGSALRHTGKTSETVTLKPISYRVTMQQLKKPGSTKTVTVASQDLVVGPPP